MLQDEKKIDLLKLHVCNSIMDFYFSIQNNHHETISYRNWKF